MSTGTVSYLQPRGRVPEDSFRVRIAIVRTLMGWNYDQAQKATGINSETWRLWEKGDRRCSDIETATAKISAATGFDRTWLIAGGPMAGPGGDGPDGTTAPTPGVHKPHGLRSVPVLTRAEPVAA